MNKEYALEVSNITKVFNGRPVIKNVSFSVDHGDIFGFLGPNGAGKTTIIRMILNLIKKDSGTVKINGFDTKSYFHKAIERVGSIVETPSFYEYLTAVDNLIQVANFHKGISRERVDEVLEIVGLTGRSKDKVGTYSLGMKQRLGIARALLNKPTLVFLDEPTNGLDPKGMIEIRNLITRLAKEQKITFFITTHLLHDVEEICNKVAILNDRELVAQDYVSNLLSKDREVIQVHTINPEQAINIAKVCNYVSNTKTIKYGIQLDISKGSSVDLVKRMVNGGVDISYVIPKKQSLEQLFIELTGGNGNG